MKNFMYTLLLCVSLSVVAFDNEENDQGFYANDDNFSLGGSGIKKFNPRRGFSDDNDPELSFDHSVFFQGQVPVLYEFIKKVDTDLEYWKSELYKQSHYSWYAKITNKIFGSFDYESKIIELSRVKQKACHALGMFLEFSYFYDENSLDASQFVLQQIKLFFEGRRLANYFHLGGKIEKFYDILESEYQTYKAPNHFKKHWKSYITGGVSLAVTVYLCSKYSAMQWCKNRVEGAKKWYCDGRVYSFPSELPDNILEKLPIDASFRIPVGLHQESVDGIALSRERLDACKLKGTRGYVHAGMFATDSQIDYVNNKIYSVQGLVENIRIGEGIHPRAMASEFYSNNLLPVVNIAQQKIMRGALFVSALIGACVGQRVVRGVYGYLYSKKKQMNSARYNIKKIHQFVLDLNCSRYEVNGALFVHTQMLLESLTGLPIEVARAIYEDIEFLQDLSIDEDEKKAIVERWYNTYLFLKI
jgi:hypothetical protein